jgi:hypothetical protein
MPRAKRIAEPVETESAEPKRSTKSVKAKITKAEAVRQAISQGHAMPTEGAAFIKSEFGIDIGPTHFSAQKTQLKKQKGAKKKLGRPAKQAQPSTIGEHGILEAMEAVKPFVASMGADKVKRIVDLLG